MNRDGCGHIFNSRLLYLSSAARGYNCQHCKKTNLKASVPQSEYQAQKTFKTSHLLLDVLRRCLLMVEERWRHLFVYTTNTSRLRLLSFRPNCKSFLHSS